MSQADTSRLRPTRRDLEEDTLPAPALSELRAPARDAVLVHIHPPGSCLGKVYKLDDGSVSVGRRLDAGILNDHPSVSRSHARIDREPGGIYQVTDLGSSNGMFVNDARVETRVLRDGDAVQFGHVVYRFLSGGSIEARYHEEIGRLALADSLTGLPNRRAFADRLDQEAARAVRHRRPLGVLMLDLDRFKDVNDWLGHLAGDFILRAVAGRLRAAVRAEDLPARYGGEEFAVILPELGREALAEVGERLRRAVADEPFEYGREMAHLTVSVGGAAATGLQPLNPADLLSWADQQLYEAKARGRNRVVV